MTSNRPSHITIVGGGIGGLTLARYLERQGISVTVYERDPSPTFRKQGGTFDMHPESGQRALSIIGLRDEFVKVCHYEYDYTLIRNKDGLPVFDDGDYSPPNERPEIERGVLRQLLLDSLDPDTIKWGYILRTITPLSSTEGSHYRLSFERATAANSTSPQIEVVDAEFVVGADGAWSRVRTLLSSQIPSYTGVSFVEFELTDVDNKHPTISKLIGPGSMWALSSNKAIMTQRLDGGRAIVYLGFRVPPTWLAWCGIPFDTNVEEAKEGLLSHFDEWSEELRDIIKACETPFGHRKIVALKTGFKWESKEHVTLIGDAAHVMSPFAGEGANLAMLDAIELGLAISGHSIRWNGKLAKSDKEFWDAVKEFEVGMWKRAEWAAKESAANLDLFMSEDAPTALAQKMKTMMTPVWVLYRAKRIALHILFIFGVPALILFL